MPQNRSAIDIATFDVITLTPTDPAAGTDINFQVPTNRRIMPISIQFRYVTDANAGNREIQLDFSDGTQVYIEIPGVNLQTASQTRVWNFLLGSFGQYNNAASTIFTNSLPENNWIDDLGAIQTSIFNIKATDQISQIFIRALSQIVE